MDAFLDGWQVWILATSCQLCVLVAAVAGVELLVGRRAWPELRMGLWSLVMLKLVLPPALVAPWSLARIVPRDLLAGPGIEHVREWTAGPGAGAAWLFAAWAAGAGGLLCFELARHGAVARGLLAGARRAPPELAALAAGLATRLSGRRPPEILVAPAAPHALVLGFLRPRVLVAPDLVQRIGSAELEHVLLHELAHCFRRDPLHGLVCLVLRAAFWFHPLVWWAAARLRVLREQCCDQAVVRSLGGDPRPYRDTLLREAQRLLLGAPATVHAFGHPRSLILQRLVLLSARSRWTRGPRALASTGVTLLVAIGCVPQGAIPAAPDPARASAATRTPTLAELPGCLQRRFLVLAALAEHERTTSGAAHDPTVK